MSLDTKRRNLSLRKGSDEGAGTEEVELMLEEDAIRFDTFLKENDHEAHKAIKRAEQETKAKQEKVQEIKKLHQEIQAVQSEMTKLREHLDDCERYKKFLDKLTPEEWFEDQKQKKLDRARERMETKRGAIRGEWEERCKAIRGEWEEKQKEEEEKRKKKKTRRKNARESPRSEGPVLPPAPEFKDSRDYLSDTEPPMYFQEPHQLLAIFTALEEQNLFLIQNSQETEQALEELKQTFRITKSEMDKDSRACRTLRNWTCRSMPRRRRPPRCVAAPNSARERMHRRSSLRPKTKVRSVYGHAGWMLSNPSTLTMLQNLRPHSRSFLLSSICQRNTWRRLKRQEGTKRPRTQAPPCPAGGLREEAGDLHAAKSPASTDR